MILEKSTGEDVRCIWAGIESGTSRQIKVYQGSRKDKSMKTFVTGRGYKLAMVVSMNA